MLGTKPANKASASKRCITCQRRRSLTRFAKCRERQDGRRSECRECKAERDRTWYLKRQRETHGLYSTFVGMKQRCHNPNHDHYRYYGARGIRICEEWRTDFEAFYEWAMNNGYARDCKSIGSTTTSAIVLAIAASSLRSKTLRTNARGNRHAATFPR